MTISNPNAYPVTVTAISAGNSDVTSGSCPAGSVTTDAVTSPTGTIAPGATGAYTLTARMIANPSNSCQNETFNVPLTATLASAAS